MISLLDSFILLLVIMDPIVSLSTFLSLAKDKNDSDRRQIVLKAVLVAFFVFMIFAVFGDAVFSILGVDINSFTAAGGIILIILGIQLSLGLSFRAKDEVSDIAVVIGTPLISGPATIMTTMILIKEAGLITTLIAGWGALIIVLLSLVFALQINRFLKTGALRILSTMMGIVTIAWGLQFLLTGLMGFF